MNPALKHFLKVAAAQVIAAVVAYLASPGALNFLGTQDAVIVGAILTPILVGLERQFLNLGSSQAPAK